MTIEERDKAIRVLEDMKVKIDIPKAAVMQNNKNWVLDMAIKELEQQTCEDAISREEAIDAVADLFEMSEYPHPYPQGKPIRLRDIKEKLKQLPSVQPKPIECEDAIIRADAINKVTNFYTNCERLKMFRHTSNEVKQTVTDILCDLPPVTPRSLNPEADREESKAYCAECDHIEMCSWYPHDGCEWLKTDRYNAEYNAAKCEVLDKIRAEIGKSKTEHEMQIAEKDI